MSESTIFVCMIGILAAGGAVAFALERISNRTAGTVAVMCTLVALVLAGCLVYGPEAKFVLGEFALPGDLSAVAAFRITPFMAVVNLLAILFGACVALYSTSYWRDRAGSARFQALSLWAVAGASVALLTSNMLVFLFAWEVTTLMLYLLIGHGGAKARKGAFKAFAILGSSDCAIILGIACLVARHGTAALSMGFLEGAGHLHVTTGADTGIYLLFLVGALAKAGAFPMHTWIPTAGEHAPAPTMALLPASLDKLLGIVLLARISLGFFSLGLGLRIMLMLIGAATILGAVMMAMVQHDLKKLLSFHAVSQVGYMVLGIGTGVPIGIVGGLFHMVNHAIYKSLLFLSAGAVEHSTGHTDLDRMGGLAGRMPMTFCAFLVGALAISGVPPLNGFASKWFVYQGIVEGAGSLMPLLLAAAVLGSALTLASFVKAMHSVFLGRPHEPGAAVESIREAPLPMLAPLAVLSGLCIALGLGAGAMVRGVLAPGLSELAPQVQMGGSLLEGGGLDYATGIWQPGAATILILVGVALGLLFYALGGAFKIRKVRPFIGGESPPPEATHLSGTSFYRTIRELPFLSGVYDNAEKETFDIYRWGAQYGSQLTGWLSSLHTGVLETYAAWVIGGTVAVLGLLYLLQ